MEMVAMERRGKPEEMRGVTACEFLLAAEHTPSRQLALAVTSVVCVGGVVGEG